LSFGSDNMPLNPLFGIHHAVNFPSEEVRISIPEAIRAYTLSNAEALSIESKMGSIAKGKYADFIVVDKSPFTVNLQSIQELVVEQTYVDGERVYNRNRI
jgi:hypothetical protein